MTRRFTRLRLNGSAQICSAQIHSAGDIDSNYIGELLSQLNLLDRRCQVYTKFKENLDKNTYNYKQYNLNVNERR